MLKTKILITGVTWFRCDRHFLWHTKTGAVLTVFDIAVTTVLIVIA